MPNAPRTQHRSIRIPDDIWEIAKARALTEGSTVSAEVNRFLEDYTRDIRNA